MKPKEKLVYIASTFPVLRETFVSREIIELEKHGMELIVVSLKNTPQEVGSEELPQAPVLYLPFFCSVRLLAEALRTFLEHPVRVVRTSIKIVWAFRSRPSRAGKFLSIVPKSLYLVRIFKKENVRHMHAHFAAVPATCAYFISQVSGLSFSFTAHAWDIYVKGTDLLLRDKMLAADRVITISDYNRKYLLSFGIDEDKVALFYQGLQLERYPFVVREPRQIPLFVAGGGLEEKKGVDIFLRALGALKKRGTSFDAKIFGDGEEKENLMRLASSLHLEGNVSFLGSMPHRDVIRLFQQADVFVMAAVRAKNGSIDGLPNVLAEAMACGATVVASDFSGIPELLRGGEDGILFPPGDDKALADALNELCSNPDLRAIYSKSARQRVEQFFDLPKNIQHLVGYFQDVLDRRR
ncbi:MAG: glycosyltransferase family 4 protein [Candidatus Latescibacterota bacterium]